MVVPLMRLLSHIALGRIRVGASVTPRRLPCEPYPVRAWGSARPSQRGFVVRHDLNAQTSPAQREAGGLAPGGLHRSTGAGTEFPAKAAHVLGREASWAAIKDAGINREDIGYINAHGTSTPVGDITELKAVGEVFSEYKPKISSTKSLAGHSLGATSVHEAIYSLIMMKNNFIAASVNITDMDEEAKKYPIVTKVEKDVTLNSVMSNSFGFGGTNATLVFEKI